ELHDNQVGALFVYQCNPVHDLPGGSVLAGELRRVPLLVCCSERMDETAEIARFVCPVPHYLETWSDAEPVNGVVSLSQPLIEPLGETRSILESLNAWMAAPSGRMQNAREILRAWWETEMFPRQREHRSFPEFWNQTLHDGVARVNPRPVQAQNFRQ